MLIELNEFLELEVASTFLIEEILESMMKYQ